MRCSQLLQQDAATYRKRPPARSCADTPPHMLETDSNGCAPRHRKRRFWGRRPRPERRLERRFIGRNRLEQELVLACTCWQPLSGAVRSDGDGGCTWPARAVGPDRGCDWASPEPTTRDAADRHWAGGGFSIGVAVSADASPQELWRGGPHTASPDPDEETTEPPTTSPLQDMDDLRQPKGGRDRAREVLGFWFPRNWDRGQLDQPSGRVRTLRRLRSRRWSSSSKLAPVLWKSSDRVQ